MNLIDAARLTAEEIYTLITPLVTHDDGSSIYEELIDWESVERAVADAATAKAWRVVAGWLFDEYAAVSKQTHSGYARARMSTLWWKLDSEREAASIEKP